MRFSSLPKTNTKSIDIDHQRLITLINSMTDAVLATDGSGIINLTNSAALSLMDSNSLLAKDIGQMLNLVDKTGKPVDIKNLAFKNAVFTSRDYKLRYGDGSVVSLFVSVSPVYQGFGATQNEGFVILLRDITAEKSLEEERDEFISVASHELRTPVAIAEGNVSNARLLAEKTQASDTILGTLKAAHDQIQFLGNLINDLSMLSRAERGKLVSGIDNFRIADLVAELRQDYGAQAQSKGIKLNISAPVDGIQLTTSRLYLKEILQNFITNSLKYTEKGSITISVEQVSEGFLFTVSDTGIGISQGDQKKLFGKFYRSDDWRVKKIPGTGLGLYVTYKLAKLIGARIDLHSEIDRGSTFSIIVPNLSQTEVAKPA